MIKEVIYNYWQSDLPEVFPRAIKLDLESDLIVDIVGPRRAGKTYLMYDAIKEISRKAGREASIYLNFENRRLLPIQKKYFNDIIEFIYAEGVLEKYGRAYLFLDEVQKIDGWEKYVRAIFDEFKGRIKIVVSGSNANLLSRDYGSLLTGRHLTVNVLPLSLKEILAFKKIEWRPGRYSEKAQSKIKKALNDYLKFGGFPEVVLEKNSSKKEEMLNQLFADILARDILSREDTRRSNLLEEFSYILASNISTLQSFNKMAKQFAARGLKISIPTLENYFRLLKNAYLFFDHTIFSYKVKDQLLYPRKIYAIDSGLVNLAGFKFSEDIGKFYENVMADELLRRSFTRANEKVFYWKGKEGREVDFVVKEGIKIKKMIQVCYNLSVMETKKREVAALIESADALKCGDLLIITADFEAEEKIGGKKIVYTPLWKWLLE